MLTEPTYLNMPFALLRSHPNPSQLSPPPPLMQAVALAFATKVPVQLVHEAAPATAEMAWGLKPLQDLQAVEWSSWEP